MYLLFHPTLNNCILGSRPLPYSIQEEGEVARVGMSVIDSISLLFSKQK